MREADMLIPDYETELDYLNCEAISQTVVELLRDSGDRALTIGVHGDWGAGKSSVLKMVEAELSENEDVAVLWFNAWTFEGFDDAKTILIESTITELGRHRSTVGKVKEKTSQLINRVNWLKVAKRSSGVAYNAITGLPSPDQIDTALEALRTFGQEAASIGAEDFPHKINEIENLLKPEEGTSLPDNIYKFREEFKDLLEEAKIKQLVVLIDDLDRCLPSTAVQTLEAIRLFLFVPKTAFVIGADEVMIEYAVRQHFPDLPIATGPLPYARNYLEKLVQVPFRIPALGAQETRTFVTLLLVQGIVGEGHEGFSKFLGQAKESLKQPWLGMSLSQADIQEIDDSVKEQLDAAFILAQQIAPILAEGTKGNPRQIKRFLNTLRVRQIIAKARGFGDQIKQPTLAKLMLAEQFQPDFYDLISSQAMSASDGKASELSELENFEETKTARKISQGKKLSKDEELAQLTERSKWLERTWLKSWLKLAPKLADEDLRPYVFVARDKRLLMTAGIQTGLELLMSKLSGSRLEARTVEQEVRTLSTADAGIIFNGLRENLLSAGSFKSEPKGIDGIAILAKHHPHYQQELVALVGSIPASNLGLWAVSGWNESITDQNARRDLIAVMRGWEEQEDNAVLKTAAANAISTLQQGGH